MVRKIERRTLINKMRRSMVRTFVKKAEAMNLAMSAMNKGYSVKTATEYARQLDKHLMNDDDFKYELLKDGSDDQPDLDYKYPNEKIKKLFKEG